MCIFEDKLSLLVTSAFKGERTELRIKLVKINAKAAPLCSLWFSCARSCPPLSAWQTCGAAQPANCTRSLDQTGALCLHCRGCPDTLICSYWDNTDTLLRVQTSAIAFRFLNGRLDCWGRESQRQRETWGEDLSFTMLSSLLFSIQNTNTVCASHLLSQHHSSWHLRNDFAKRRALSVNFNQAIAEKEKKSCVLGLHYYSIKAYVFVSHCKQNKDEANWL